MQQKISVTTITFSSDIFIILRVLCYNMEFAELSDHCVNNCRLFVRIDLN